MREEGTVVNSCKEGKPKADAYRMALNSLQCIPLLLCHIQEWVGCMLCILLIGCKLPLCHLSCGVVVVFLGSACSAYVGRPAAAESRGV